MTAYGQAALDAEVAALRSTGSGGRNGQLNKSAFAIAQLVAGDQLDAEPARAALRDAANETGLERREVQTALASGWKAGLEVPRYPYRDEGGRVIYAKARVDKPDRKYEYQRPDGAGGWASGRGDVEAVPYRLPELIAAPKDAVIYMAEGEKHADKLASWGLVATSHKDWRGFEFAGYVRGRTVVILPDNDEEGEACAERAAAKVVRAEGNPVIVRLPRLPEKGDIMDWDGDAAELAALVEVAANQPAETFAVADLTAWANTAPTPKAFAMAGFIPEEEVTLFTGPGGANKSTFGLQLCACAAAGLPMLGVDVAPARALYFTAEDDDRENHWRLTKIAAAMKIGVAQLAGRLGIVSLRGRLNNELATFDAEGRLRPSQTFATLRATIEAAGAKLVVLDNVGHLFAGNENDRGQVTSFVNLLYQLCRELGVTIVLIAHPNKQFLQGKDEGNAFSGSTAWLNAVRSQLLIQRPSNSVDPDARTLSLGKANYARPDQQLAFRWEDFALVRDQDLSADRRAELAKTIAAGNENEAFIACLRERDRQGEGRGVGPSSGPNYAPSQFAGMAESKGLTKDQLTKAMGRLFAIGRIETYEHKVVGKGRSVTLIREVPNTPERTPERLPNTGPEHPRTVPPNTPAHTPYTTYRGRGPEGSAAPTQEWSSGWGEGP